MALLRRDGERGVPVVVRLGDRAVVAGKSLHHREVLAPTVVTRCGVQRGAPSVVRERQRRPEPLREVNQHPEQPSPSGVPQRGPPIDGPVIDVAATGRSSRCCRATICFDVKKYLYPRLGTQYLVQKQRLFYYRGTASVPSLVVQLGSR